MERQFKERLIGAAVLVAAAVIMVPEMFSGPRDSLAPETDSVTAAANQVKTYRVELKSTSAAAVATSPPVEPPADRPLDEVQDVQTNPETVAAVIPKPEQKAEVPVAEPSAPATSAATPEKAKPVSTTEAPKPAGGAGWMVQVGSFSAQATAQQIAAKLKSQGFSAFVGSVQVNGKTLYRVRVGALADRASADSALQKLRGTYPGASVVAPGH